MYSNAKCAHCTLPVRDPLAKVCSQICAMRISPQQNIEFQVQLPLKGETEVNNPTAAKTPVYATYARVQAQYPALAGVPLYRIKVAAKDVDDNDMFGVEWSPERKRGVGKQAKALPPAVALYMRGPDSESIIAQLDRVKGPALVASMDSESDKQLQSAIEAITALRESGQGRYAESVPKPVKVRPNKRAQEEGAKESESRRTVTEEERKSAIPEVDVTPLVLQAPPSTPAVKRVPRVPPPKIVVTMELARRLMALEAKKERLIAESELIAVGDMDMWPPKGEKRQSPAAAAAEPEPATAPIAVKKKTQKTPKAPTTTVPQLPPASSPLVSLPVLPPPPPAPTVVDEPSVAMSLQRDDAFAYESFAGFPPDSNEAVRMDKPPTSASYMPGFTTPVATTPVPMDEDQPLSDLSTSPASGSRESLSDQSASTDSSRSASPAIPWTGRANDEESTDDEGRQ